MRQWFVVFPKIKFFDVLVFRWCGRFKSCYCLLVFRYQFSYFWHSLSASIWFTILDTLSNFFSILDFMVSREGTFNKETNYFIRNWKPLPSTMASAMQLYFVPPLENWFTYSKALLIFGVSGELMPSTIAASCSLETAHSALLPAEAISADDTFRLPSLKLKTFWQLNVSCFSVLHKSITYY